MKLNREDWNTHGEVFLPNIVLWMLTGCSVTYLKIGRSDRVEIYGVSRKDDITRPSVHPFYLVRGKV